MNNYGYDSIMPNIFDGLSAGTTLFASAIVILIIACWWFLFEKAGRPGWAALIPFYNEYKLFEITWGNGWFFLLLFLSIIPFFGWIALIVVNVLTQIYLAKSFGKGGGFAVGLIFLPIIFLPILAFGDAVYYGSKKNEFGEIGAGSRYNPYRNENPYGYRNNPYQDDSYGNGWNNRQETNYDNDPDRRW